jgi:hypothetical protein
VVVGALVGLGVGAAAAALLLWLTGLGLRWLYAPKIYEVEHSVYYLSIILGAGFGSLCGALAGLAHALTATRGTASPPSQANPERPSSTT